jgi:hypothetical protein
MPTPILLAETLLERTTGFFDFAIVDQAGTGIALALLDSLELTYYDVASGAVINNRLHQNALNANHVTVVTVPGPPLITTVTFELQPADTIIVNDAHALEQRVIQFLWTWNGGTRTNGYVVQFGVENLLFVP